MERVAIGEVEPRAFGDDAEGRGLSEPLGTTDVAINHYRIAPGDGFPSGLHAHEDQEEIFVVLEGEATFETLGPERNKATEITVREGEAIRFAPGDFQTGRNDGDADLVALALGAPPNSEDVRVPLDCPECGHGDLRPEWSDGGAFLVCPNCDAENVPQGCPECGHEMEVALGEDAQTVVVCPDCGARAENPFEN